MGDLLVDFRPAPRRYAGEGEELRFYPDMRMDVLRTDAFLLAVSSTDEPDLWAPYGNDALGITVALAGRVAFDDPAWDAAEEMPGIGGAAAKVIAHQYLKDGVSALKRLNGNYLVFLFDAKNRLGHVITDRCGMVPCFRPATESHGPVFCSHPDVLAGLLDVASDWDLTSLAEFLVTGKVSYPFTYYRDVRAAEFGSVHTLQVPRDGDPETTVDPYFAFQYNPDDSLDETDLAESLGEALKKAVRRRSHPRFGQTAIALSGGLDSRTLFCAAENPADLVAFCFFDEENAEYRIARRIARAAGAELVPLQRKFDHYGEQAAKAVQIYGGMGNMCNNHFLGFRNHIRELGVASVITGFYCDYFFKGLALDRRRESLLRGEVLAEYRPAWYRPYIWLGGGEDEQVRSRLSRVFPQDLIEDTSDAARLQREYRRVFPLHYEPDHAETTVPQRVMPWFLPIVDSDVIDVYLRIPPAPKLNAALFARTVASVCGPGIAGITNINTGAPANAGPLRRGVHVVFNVLRNRMEKQFARRIALSGSWPNWDYYVQHSRLLKNLWLTQTSEARQLFQSLVEEDPYDKPMGAYRGESGAELFTRFLTLKLWVDQRNGRTPETQ